MYFIYVTLIVSDNRIYTKRYDNGCIPATVTQFTEHDFATILGSCAILLCPRQDFRLI